MTAAKSIDWTRPLRTVGSTRLPVSVANIRPKRGEYCVQLDIYGCASRWASKDGRFEGCTMPCVENVPPEPRIVEGWTVVEVHADYSIWTTSAKVANSREEARHGLWGGRRIARILIEEPGT